MTEYKGFSSVTDMRQNGKKFKSQVTWYIIPERYANNSKTSIMGHNSSQQPSHFAQQMEEICGQRWNVSCLVCIVSGYPASIVECKLEEDCSHNTGARYQSFVSIKVPHPAAHSALRHSQRGRGW